jgi:thiol-disulfide isomerase/thioredoxin
MKRILLITGVILLFAGLAAAGEAVKPGEIKPDEFKPEKDADLEKMLKLDDTLKNAFGNWPEIAKALKAARSDRFLYLVEMLDNLTELELIETDSETLLEHLDFALKTRKEAKWEITDKAFISNVLNPHHKYIPLRKWRKTLYEYFAPIRRDSIEETAKAVNEWVARNIKEDEERLTIVGVRKTPALVLCTGTGRKYEIGCFTAAVLRSLGIPARMHKNLEWVEFLSTKKSDSAKKGESKDKDEDEGEWLPLFPLKIEDFANKSADEEVEKEYEEKGKLTLTFMQKGKPMAKSKRFFSIAKMSEKGFFELVYGYETTDNEGKVETELAPGKYRLTAGVRNRNGEPYIFHKKLKIKSGDDTKMTVVLDIPIEQYTEADCLVRELEEIPERGIKDEKGNDVNMKELVEKRKEVLLVFFKLGNEPCQKMLPMLVEFANKNKTHAMFVYIGEKDDVYEEFLKENKCLMFLISEEDAKKEFHLPYNKKTENFRSLPVTLLFKNGKLAAWQEGFDMSLGKLLEIVLEKK